MSKHTKAKTRPRDVNLLAFVIVQECVGEDLPEEEKDEKTKNPAAVELGKLGGKKVAKQEQIV